MSTFVEHFALLDPRTQAQLTREIADEAPTEELIDVC